MIVTIGKKEVWYEWRSELLPVGKNNEMKRVSDWNEAGYCSCCNKKIVHIFIIDGKAFGFDCLKKSMGLGGISYYKKEYIREKRIQNQNMRMLIDKLNKKTIKESELEFYDTPKYARIRLYIETLNNHNVFDDTEKLCIKSSKGYAIINDRHFRFPEFDFELVGMIKMEIPDEAKKSVLARISRIRNGR